MTATITPIPPLDRTAPTFKSDLEAMFSTYFPNLTVELPAFISALSTIASGGAFDIPFKFSATTTAGDPGAGFLRLNSGSISTVTAIYADVVSSDTKDYTALLDTMGASTSTVLGTIKLIKLNDPTKFAHFRLTVLTTQTGYRQLTVTPTAYSDAMPFQLNDIVLFRFFQTGDRGSIGPAGSLIRRTSALANNAATLTPDPSTSDMVTAIGLQQATTFAAPAPSGAAPGDGQTLMMRIKDSGTARALVWNAAYRASGDLTLPTTTTANKLMYLGFVYNAADAKWDFVSLIGNF
jgi:hypothetical protein